MPWIREWMDRSHRKRAERRAREAEEQKLLDLESHMQGLVAMACSLACSLVSSLSAPDPVKVLCNGPNCFYVTLAGVGIVLHATRLDLDSKWTVWEYHAHPTWEAVLTAMWRDKQAYNERRHGPYEAAFAPLVIEKENN